MECSCCGLEYEMPTGPDVSLLAVEFCDDCRLARCDIRDSCKKYNPLPRPTAAINNVMDLIDTLFPQPVDEVINQWKQTDDKQGKQGIKKLIKSSWPELYQALNQLAGLE